MAKKSQKRPSRHERDQAGCISGLISIFDFRNGRSTRKLLVDRRRTSKQAVGAGRSSAETIQPGTIEKCENVVDVEESKMPKPDVSKTSVKELIEEEMFNEQGSTNQSNNSEKGPETNNGRQMKNKQSRKNSKSMDMGISKLDEQKPSDNLDLETIVEELAHHSDLDIPIVEEKLVAALKLFIEQRPSKNTHFDEEGSNSNSCYSKELIDALQMLSLNKDSFLKLLKDPNSELVKHIQDLELEKKDEKPIPLNLKPDKSSRNFFRRRTKSMDNSYPTSVEDKIVILKPGPADFMQNERNTSQFSFTEIKRKLRHAMGKEKNGISPDKLLLKYSPKHQNLNNGEKSGPGENLGWSSPNRNHFFTERFTISSPSFRNGEPVKEKSSNSNLYIEAKKHLSEMLKNGDENAESKTGQLPKSLGRILSLPEYNSSPCPSPRKQGDEMFLTAQMRLSPRGLGKSNLSGISQENLSYDEKVESPNDRDCSLEIQSFTEDTVIQEVQSASSSVAEIEEATEQRPQEEEKITDISSESCSNSITIMDSEESGPQFLKDSSEAECFNSVLFGEDQIPSSPHSPASREAEDSECATDKIGRPSPISVLEPIFVDDDISPPNTKSEPVEIEIQIQPRHINFEEEQQRPSSTNDQGICTRISLEDEESAFEYVEAVLLGSGLNWDEFLSRWLAFYEILDPSLFDEVELFSSRARYDQKLLFDCANKALKSICESHFGCFTGILNNKKRNKTGPVPKGMDLINEVWGRVECQLSRDPQPHSSLDQLVKIDLARSRKWMDIKKDIEHIGFEMGDIIFDELVDEFVDEYDADL